MTNFRRLALLVVLGVLLTATTACHKSYCRDTDSRYRDKDCRD